MNVLSNNLYFRISDEQTSTKIRALLKLKFLEAYSKNELDLNF